MKTLNYTLDNPTGVSLNPVDSDNIVNAIVMQHVVGTLVRYSNGGQFSPYLAHKFKSEDKGRIWRFTLRDDLKCEDGEVVTAQGYINGLRKVLKMYLTNGPIPLVQELAGWKAFTEGGELSGLTAISNSEVQFNFDTTVGNGFLEYLSMPYYGYFCASNFDGNQWNHKHKIVSSGPYKIADLKDNKEFNLNLVKPWPLNPEKAPEQVHFSCLLNENSWKQSHAVIQKNLGWGDKTPEGYKEVAGPPDMLRSAILDPQGGTQFFADIENRRLLQAKLMDVRKRHPFSSHTARLADGFYPGSVPTMVKSKIEVAHPKAPVKVFGPKTMSDETKFALDVLKESLTELGWPYEYFAPGDEGIALEDARSTTKFDIRLVFVVAGSTVEPWVVEMIFGSSQGVSYPDPSGRLVKYAKELMHNSGISLHDAGKNISQIISEDSAVIPIFAGHTTWYFKDDLDLSRISGNMILPSFEDISFKE